MEPEVQRAVRVTLSGESIPELKGKEVIIFMDIKSTLTMLTEIKAEPLGIISEPLNYPWSADAFDAQGSANPSEINFVKILEEAAERLFKRVEESGNS